MLALLLALVACSKVVTYEPPPEKRVADVEHQSLDEAKGLAAKGDIDGAHAKLGQIKRDSPLCSTSDFTNIQNDWAKHQLDLADKERDPAKKISTLQAVAGDTTVSGELRAKASQKIEVATPDPAIPPPDYGYDRAAAVERVNKARAWTDAKKYREVRDLLMGPVLSGKCAPEEVELLVSACYALQDRQCGAMLLDAGVKKPKN